jgi:hypothetical protein
MHCSLGQHTYSYIFQIQNFENIRKPYLETTCIYTLCPNLKTCNNEIIFIWIMGCENPEALRTLSKLIIKLTSERDLYLKNIWYKQIRTIYTWNWTCQVHAIIHGFGSKKLAPCKNFSWLLNWHLKMAPGDFSGSNWIFTFTNGRKN